MLSWRWGGFFVRVLFPDDLLLQQQQPAHLLPQGAYKSLQETKKSPSPGFFFSYLYGVVSRK